MLRPAQVRCKADAAESLPWPETPSNPAGLSQCALAPRTNPAICTFRSLTIKAPSRWPQTKMVNWSAAIRQARRAIISHTLPLTLTDRLWTGMRRDGTIGLYRAAAGWYDPYSTQGIHAGVSVPRAPAGLSLGGTQRSIPAQAGDTDWLGAGWDVAVNTHNAWLGDVIANAIKVYLRTSYGRTSGQLSNLLLNYSMARQNLKKIAFAQGMIRQTAPNDILRRAFLSLQQRKYTRQFGAFWNNNLSNWKTLNRLNWWTNPKTLGPDLVELGGGVVVDVGVSGLFELPMLLSGDLTFAQYAGRRGVAAVGSGVSWFVGWGTKKALEKWFLATTGTVNIWGMAVTVSVSLAWGWWIEPWIYEQWPALYPKSERIGPAEDLPW